MRHFALFVILSSSLACPAFAATDPGLSSQGSANVFRQHGLGAQMQARIKLGAKKQVKASERVALGVAIGPRISSNSSSGRVGISTAQSSMIGFSLRPGYSAQLSFAGQPVVQHLTRRGAAEDNANPEAKPDKKGPSTLGWIAIGFGALTVTSVTLAVISLRDDCLIAIGPECNN
jgi:hypothetical protein